MCSNFIVATYFRAIVPKIKRSFGQGFVPNVLSAPCMFIRSGKGVKICFNLIVLMLLKLCLFCHGLSWCNVFIFVVPRCPFILLGVALQNDKFVIIYCVRAPHKFIQFRFQYNNYSHSSSLNSTNFFNHLPLDGDRLNTGDSLTT